MIRIFVQSWCLAFLYRFSPFYLFRWTFGLYRTLQQDFYNQQGQKVQDSHHLVTEYLHFALCWNFCFLKILFILSIGNAELQLQVKINLSDSYTQCLKIICIISSISRISFHNDILHGSSLRIFITHLILIRLLILLML